MYNWIDQVHRATSYSHLKMSIMYTILAQSGAQFELQDGMVATM